MCTLATVQLSSTSKAESCVFPFVDAGKWSFDIHVYQLIQRHQIHNLPVQYHLVASFSIDHNALSSTCTVRPPHARDIHI